MTVQMTRLVEQDINLRLVTGQTLILSPKEHWRMFFDWDSAIFFCAMFCLITFVFPVPPEAVITWWMKFSGFAMFMLLIPIIYFVQVLGVALISMRFPRFVIFEPFLLMVTGLGIEIIDHSVQPLIFGQEWADWVGATPFAEQVIGTIILLQMLHVVFCVFVLPRKTTLRILGAAPRLPQVLEAGIDGPAARGDAVSTPQPEDATTAHHYAPGDDEIRQDVEGSTASALIQLDGHALPIQSILAIEAEEHYVRVWTEGRELYVRQSFGGLISRMNESDGFSPRRGIWFSFRNVDEIRRHDSGKFVIIPLKGPATVVPKAKASQVRQLMKLHYAGAQRADAQS